MGGNIMVVGSVVVGCVVVLRVRGGSTEAGSSWVNGKAQVRVMAVRVSGR